jgi:TM2 domain-containing membrane protein YozV
MTTQPLPPKDVGTAYLFWLVSFVFVCGLQHFYLGKIVRGVIWLLTVGLFGVGTLVDLFTLRGQVRDVNERRAAGIQ